MPHGRALSFGRLATLYALLEQARSVELQQAAAGVRQIERAEAQERLVALEQARDGREALLSGDDWGRWVARVEGAAPEARMRRLAELRGERERMRLEALKAQRASRVSADQMKDVALKAQTQEAEKERRRVQAQSDDRFASRREWQRQQDAASKE